MMATADLPENGPPPPRANPDLLGQETAEATLLEAATSGRLAHAWLLTGPRGIGKATLAYRFARFLLSGGAEAGQGGPSLFGEPEPAASLHVAPESPLFRRIAAGGHADLLTVERTAGSTGKLRAEIVVEDVRGVGAFMTMTAAEGGWRVVVVDAADEMNRNAANALLKVLEEPPARALLLLVAHNPGRLLPTIRSRCRTLALAPLADDVVEGLLARHAPDLAPGDRAALAALADGSIGRALDLAAEGGLDLHRDMARLLAGLPDLDVPALHDLAGRVAGPTADGAYRVLTDLIRRWLGALVTDAARGRGPADPAEAALAARLLADGGLDRWLEVWEKINRLLARADGANLDRKQIVLNIFLALETAARG
ncbi:MAG: DNA polymerase III subunit delta' [Rhodobacterales bacterium]|nr:DNA polymerase III subunit delta' [Rhodobacterales bacterium]